jgi:hypothetical protein
MGVSLAPVARPSLSPSYPRRRASSPLVPLPWIPAFAGMTKPAVSMPAFWGPLESIKLLMNSLIL